MNENSVLLLLTVIEMWVLVSLRCFKLTILDQI